MRMRMATPTVPLPPTMIIPFGGLPFTKYPSRPSKTKLFFRPSRRRARYKPSIYGITMPAVRFKPPKIFTGLETRRIRK
jgi:hypothetical protein